MTAASVLERLASIRIIPVIVIDDAHQAPEVAAAMLAGGIATAEITLRTPAALSAIEAISGIPNFLAGAGTVLSAEDVDRCVDAGAQYLITPGFDDQVVERAQFHDVAILPGIATATEIQRALRTGLDVVKFFPADRLGGLETIAALSAPFSTMRFVPSGGVKPNNVAEYLRHPAIFAVSGSWMATRGTIAAGSFDEIEQLSRAAARLASEMA